MWVWAGIWPAGFQKPFPSIQEAELAFEGKIRLSDRIWPPFNGAPGKEKDRAETDLRNTRIAQPAIGAISLAMASVLSHFGLRPDACCGHSFGELTALCVAGCLQRKDFLDPCCSARGQLMAGPVQKTR
jgi:acyl transferase domain-containing protein